MTAVDHFERPFDMPLGVQRCMEWRVSNGCRQLTMDQDIWGSGRVGLTTCEWPSIVLPAYLRMGLVKWV